ELASRVSDFLAAEPLLEAPAAEQKPQDGRIPAADLPDHHGKDHRLFNLADGHRRAWATDPPAPPPPTKNRKPAGPRPPICRTITAKITACSIWQMATVVPGRQIPPHNRRTGASGYPHSAQCHGKYHGG